MSVSKPTIMEQIIVARINKQKALEEGRAVKQKVEAPAVKAVETPRKLVTRRAAEQKEESGGKCIGCTVGLKAKAIDQSAKGSRW